MYIPKEQKQKIDDKVIPFMILGYRDIEFGYMLQDLTKQKLIRSRDVVFHEQKFFIDIRISKKHSDTSFMPIAILISPSVKRATNGREMH